MEHYLSLFVRAIFIENMALSFFWACVLFSPCQRRSRPRQAWAWR